MKGAHGSLFSPSLTYKANGLKSTEIRQSMGVQRLRLPVEGDRAVHGMWLGLARTALFQQIRFEREIPFGGAVRVVDQHEARIVLQALGLADHRFLILA